MVYAPRRLRSSVELQPCSGRASNIKMKKGNLMKLLDILRDTFFWPGTVVTKKLNIDPESEFGLLRSLFNSLVWTTIGLGVLFLFVI